MTVPQRAEVTAQRQMDAGEGRPAGAARTGRPTHASRPLPRPGRIAAWVGTAAALVAVGVGTTALVRDAGSVSGRPASFEAITVAGDAPAVLPLSDPEVLALLDRNPDLGALTEPGRRASCLAGLGYPAATRVLGAVPVQVRGRPAILLVLPGDGARTVVALAVAPNCSSADTGLVVNTTLSRP